jgi:hypothetical protein
MPIFFDYNSTISQHLLDFLNISSIYFTCPFDIPEFSTSNASEFLTHKFLQFISPFFSYFHEKNASIIYATDQFLPDEVLEFAQQFSPIFYFQIY